MAWNNSNNNAPISAFNEAGNQIARLDALWNKANNYHIEGNLMDWRWTLEVIWHELYSDAINSNNDLSKNDYIITNRATNKLISKAVNNNNRKSLYNLLSYKHSFLKQLQNLVGKGSSYREEDDSDEL
ncbi:MAG TPA: hypothetical protein PLT65_05560 [Bacilli bacterium]|nr:hypothetical protein [Bacilli bacterium]